MEADRRGLGLIEEERVHSLANIRSQFRPGISLSENVVRKTLGDEAAVRFLSDRKDEFHANTIANSALSVNLRFMMAAALF